MYMDKQVKRGYNEYIRLDEGIGKDAMMDVALLVMEDGDTWSCEEPEKEVAALVFDGKCTIKWEDQSYDVDRPNPFDYNPSCLHVCKGVKFEIIAHGPCNIYIQKTINEKTFPSKMYKPEDTDTWARGNKGELMGCIKRDVRTCFDLDNAPYSNMVLGEVVNLPGKWSSYPPHHHPQPECYFYRYDKPMGFWLEACDRLNLQEFKSCRKMLANWRPYILNAFDIRLSNGFTEGCNNAIKNLNPLAFGFRIFGSFRSRILLATRAHPYI